MKLVRIDHERCNEPDGVTWCFAPDDWDQDKLEEAVRAATREYQDAVNAYMEWKKEELSPPWTYSYSQPNYSSYPDMLVKDVKAKFDAEKEKAQKKEAVRRKALRTFAAFLADHGIVQFEDMEPDLTDSVWWGHQHGAPLDYRQKDPWHMDKRINEDDDDD